MNVDAKFKDGIFRRDYPQIIAINRHQCTILPVRLSYNASGLAAGTVLGQNSVNSEYAAYSSGGASGLDTAKCVLLDPADVTEFPSTTGSLLSRALFGGSVYKAKLVGLDSNGETDLGAKTIKDATGVEILKF